MTKLIKKSMSETLQTVLLVSESIRKNNDLIKSNGNPDFVEILNSYPKYVSKKNEFIANPPIKEETRGAKATVEYSEDVCFLAYLVQLLYIKNKKTFTSNDWEKVKRVINGGISGETDFFDPVRSKMWIDVFSALDYGINIFASNETSEFIDFFENYVSLYGKMNNKKTVPFYSRWIREIAAMYTIYLNETYDEFEHMATTLQAALEKGVSPKSKKRLSHYETDSVRDYIMSNIFIAYEKDKDSVIPMLCEYIAANPDEFVYEKGTPLDKRYRRYYCAIREMLCWIVDETDFNFENEKLIKVFCNDDIDYSCKDDNIHMLESELVNTIIYLSKSDPDDVIKKYQIAKWLNFLISEPKDVQGRYKVKKNDTGENKTDDEWIEYCKTYQLMFSNDFIPGDGIAKGEIVFEVFGEDEYEDQLIKRSHEQVVDSVVKLLRFFIMVAVISKEICEDKHEWEQCSKETIIYDINDIMKRHGLLALPTHHVNGFNDKSKVDFCILKCIEESTEKKNKSV